jgi:hypothetical protein
MTPEERAERSDWLIGPKVVEWLASRGLRHPDQQLTGNQARRFRDWKNGGAAYVYTLDAMLVRLDLRLSEVPIEFYLPGDPRGHGGVKRISTATRQGIVAARKAGRRTLAVAKEFGVSTTTVRLVGKANGIPACNGSQKLGPEDARAIRERMDEDSDALATEFGVHRSTIQRIKRGAMWTDA